MKQQHSSAISNGSLEYQPGELPDDFHKKVVDLEIQIEMHGVQQKDNEGHIKMLSDLMQLYSVSYFLFLIRCKAETLCLTLASQLVKLLTLLIDPSYSTP